MTYGIPSCLTRYHRFAKTNINPIFPVFFKIKTDLTKLKHVKIVV